MELEKIQNKLLEIKKSFEKYLEDNQLGEGSFHPNFRKALNEMVLVGGKRFRPMLLLSVVAALSPEKLVDSYRVAQGVEVMHTYSLLHDDLPVMDDADLRRGHPTLHKTYDDVTAVLVGDALNTDCFGLIAGADLDAEIKVKLISELALNSGSKGMVLGQAIDCYYDASVGSSGVLGELDLEQINFLHKYKTGKIIAGALKMGGIIVGLNDVFCKNLYDFGLELGLLFQIQDDVFDVTLSSSDAGKTVGRDEGKNTFVSHLGLDGARAECERLVVRLESGLACFDANLRQYLKILLRQYIYRHRQK